MLHLPVINYAIATLLWGTTWWVILTQIDGVAAELAIAHRFALAAAILWLYCRWRGLEMRVSGKLHFTLAAQGLCLFGLNYWLFYLSELYLTSGLVALSCILILYFNALNARCFMGQDLRPAVLVGGALGVVGMALVFLPEIMAFSFSRAQWLAVAMCALAAYLASWGNLLSGYHQARGLGVLKSNCWGMTYGALAMYALSLGNGSAIYLPTAPSFLAGLLYLSVFGTIFAFGTYLKLIGQIGADRAAYIFILVPVVALLVSTLLEGYSWNWLNATGVVVALLGNYLALRR